MTGRRRASTAIIAAAAVIVGLAGCGTGASPARSAAGASAAPASTAAVGAVAPAGTFTTLGGARVDVASYRGRPALLWFIAAGCSSCTASIPALAAQLPRLRAEHVQVAVIDLYGDIGSSPGGAAALRKLRTELLGAGFRDAAAWTWGVSSQLLSYRYDSFGEPDVYYVLNRAGEVSYRNGVPVSTMSQLLAHAAAAAQA